MTCAGSRSRGINSALLQGISPKTASKLTLACLHNSLNGYHFLSHIDFQGDQTGFVVLLRQIYHLPLPTALAVARGVELDDNTLAALPIVSLQPGAFAMPIGQLASPYLEHLMQNFSTLFSRIGVPDLPHDFQQYFVGG